jgi:hypothetical protein
VFEDRVLRRIFGPKREKVVGDCRRLHNEELHNLYTSPNIRAIKSRKLRWAEHVTRMGEMRNAYSILVGKLVLKRPLRRPRQRWTNNIRVDLREIGWEGVEWMNLAQDRDQWLALVNMVMNHRIT